MTPATTPSPTGPASATALAPRPLIGRLLDAPVRWAALDRVAAPITKAVHAVEPRWLADLLHGTWLGHPLHPVLAQVAVGSWTSASLLDALALAGLVPDDLAEGAEAASTTLVATGIASALPTYATGWTDWADLHEDQQRLGLVHAASNFAATALYVLSLVQRARGRRGSGRWLSVAAVSTATAGAALGGQLAYRWAAGASHAEHVPHVAPEGEYRVARWADLEQRRPVQGRVGDVAVVVVRDGDAPAVLADACSHLSASLAEGEVTQERGRACLVCPWHASAFALDDGHVVHGPATAPQPVFDARVDAEGWVLASVRQLPGVQGGPRLPSAA